MLILIPFHRKSLREIHIAKALVPKIHVNFCISYELIDFPTCPNSAKIYCLFYHYTLLYALYFIMYIVYISQKKLEFINYKTLPTLS